MGIDADGRERLRFIPGDVAIPPYPTSVQADSALGSIARPMRLTTDPLAHVFVAEAPHVIGCSVVRPDNEVPAGMLLDRLYVHPRWWGNGVGRRLHDTALAAAGHRGVDKLNLWVLEANTKARTMYERWGWKLVPGWTLPNQPPTALDVLYQRPLNRTAQKT